MEVIKRMNNLTILQFSADQALNGNTLSGYAHVFGARAKVGGQYEEMRKGSFDDALARSDVRAFYQHDRNLLLGRQSSGTLRVFADSKGLGYEIDLPNTTYANDLRELIARGDLNEMSFGFIPKVVSWSKAKDGLAIRSHESVGELVDISPVTIPAFSGTSITMRGQSDLDQSLASQLVRVRNRHINIKGV
jgi:hypothetical protein